ncbi:hypothetical protein ACT459_002404, partial [Enterococcus faecalis]
MKQTKWQRLATIGLCSSLVMNAFSGVTAVAETVTIESSPTAESSAKEETPASSVKEETTKASTQNSQVTADTSQEEATKDAEKQAETEVKEAQKEEPQAEVEQAETATSEVVQPNPLLAPTPVSGLGEKSLPLAELLPQLLTLTYNKSYPLGTSITFPSGLIEIMINSSGKEPLNINDFNLSAKLALREQDYNNPVTEQNVDKQPLVSKHTNGFNIDIPGVTITPEKSTTAGRVRTKSYYLKDSILEVPRYVNNVDFSTSQMRMLWNVAPIVLNATQYKAEAQRLDATHYQLNAKNPTITVGENQLYYFLTVTGGATPSTNVATYTPHTTGLPTVTVDFRKVTENFVDTNGAKITPPTGFTQGKQTAITSDPYIFKQAGTLPDTYTTGGKTYKFKGWYKGKTKTEPLKTTKAPSYGVTYDDNDDLNVVYEEINFPEVTYQFGFVNEAGQLVNPADIKITYDYKSQSFRGSGGLPTDTISEDTIVTNQSATTVGNLKNVTLPAAYIPRPTETGWNGNGYANFSIKLPRYYQSLNLYDKTGKINPNYPLPVITEVMPIGNVDRSEKAVISDLTLTQRADKSFTLTESVNSQSNGKVTRVRVLSREINSSNILSGVTHYYTFGSPAYYHLT